MYFKIITCEDDESDYVICVADLLATALTALLSPLQPFTTSIWGSRLALLSGGDRVIVPSYVCNGDLVTLMKEMGEKGPFVLRPVDKKDYSQFQRVEAKRYRLTAQVHQSSPKKRPSVPLTHCKFVCCLRKQLREVIASPWSHKGINFALH